MSKLITIEYSNLDAILVVGFRVRSHRGTLFRQWAIEHLNEYLVKGFTIDDERLKPFTCEIPPDHPRGSLRNWVGLMPEALRKKWLK